MTLHRGGQRLRTTRAALIDAHGPTCGRCGSWIDVRLSGLDPMGLTVGHIIPLAKGGTDAFSNLRPEHRACNLAASDRRDPPRARIAVPIGGPR